MRLVFHLGYPRTGTTFLQTHIFPKHKEINYLGPKNYNNLQDVKINQITLDKFRDFYLLNKQNDFTSDVIKFFDREKVNIISSEKYTTFKNSINDFYDCKYIEELFRNEELEISFLIVLRNQYDLLNSFYHHMYPISQEFLKIDNFERLVNKIADGLDSSTNNLNLRLFLSWHDFNLIDKKLKNLFTNVKIKYLFYEDFKYHKNIFIEEFSDFLKLDKAYTKSLFDKDPVNERKMYKKNQLIITPLKYEILNNKTFIALKNILPSKFRRFFLPFFRKYFIYTKAKISDGNRSKSIIKEYYKDSNKIFFKNTKLKNKFDY